MKKMAEALAGSSRESTSPIMAHNFEIVGSNSDQLSEQIDQLIVRNRDLDGKAVGKSNANGSPHVDAVMHALFEKLDVDQGKFGNMKPGLQVKVQDLMLVFVSDMLDRGEDVEM